MTVVYDVEQSGFTGQWFGLGSAVLGAAFVACLLLRGRLGRMKLWGGPTTMPLWIFGALWLGIAQVVVGSLFFGALGEQRHDLAAVHDGACRAVAGPVESLRVAGYENHKNVSFSVQGTSVSYAQNDLSGITVVPRDRKPFGEGTSVVLTVCPGMAPGARERIARLEVP